MSGNASWLFPQGGREKTGDATPREVGRSGGGLSLASSRGDPPGAGITDLHPDELVARAFTILDNEQERWRAARAENVRPETPS
jgi:hypothetical protein